MRLLELTIDVYNRDDHLLSEQIEGREIPIAEEEWITMPCALDLDFVECAYKVRGDTRRSEYTRIETRGGMCTAINIDYTDFLKAWKKT
jgi:hypothetical protein